MNAYLFFDIVKFIIGSTIILILSRKGKLEFIKISNYLVFGAIIGILGAKMYSVIFTFLSSPGFYVENPGLLWNHFNTGGAYYGGFLLVVFYSIIYVKKFLKKNFWTMFDITVIGLAIDQMFGRIGCFAAGCCYGKPTSIPWGVKFHFLDSRPHPFSNTYIHPTQIYECILNLCNFFFLFLMWKKRKYEGKVFSFYLINYGFIRFFIEYLRNDDGRGYLIRGSSALTSLSYPQIISLILIITGIIILKKRKGIERAKSILQQNVYGKQDNG
ncbi:MAG: prolipoprotein diacylglyceryl transferase [Candidatus Aminicenantes bacterium]|nr:prolipoprotein diacylglyceryl transferase [Candidatus Aminicenantes bacterium]NIM77861.1 prolipoprotein diacylglyceryl transferase [Candidatus Aminicenantes bacterium]NIN17173.1 prolipoprotein diacylglyceryl transferase [Candidatus Aminicenantes bacterium]NIN41066.1 prolipoprotein diacylglyceryl transferase [Candidatus Aminicenantes bacterium]NIN83871.1 prolipoprotein diacylglyceryl transferase [Candidatus Aminicenantes bacterium]